MNAELRKPRTFAAVLMPSLMSDHAEFIQKEEKERVSRWRKRVDQDDPFHLVTGAFIFIEGRVENLYRLALPHLPNNDRTPRDITPRVQILRGLGVLTAEELRAIMLLIRIRNDFVHDEKYEVERGTICNLYDAVMKAFPESLRLTPRPNSDVGQLRASVVGIYSLLYWRGGAMSYQSIRDKVQKATSEYREHAIKNLMPFGRNTLFEA